MEDQSALCAHSLRVLLQVGRSVLASSGLLIFQGAVSASREDFINGRAVCLQDLIGIPLDVVLEKNGGKAFIQ